MHDVVVLYLPHKYEILTGAKTECNGPAPCFMLGEIITSYLILASTFFNAT